MIRSKLVFVVLLLLCGLGCGKSDDAATGKKQIKLVHFYVDQKELWKQVAEGFEKANPNYDVTVEAIPFGVYTTKIQAAAATGSALGDVVLIDDWFAQELFKRDYTIALDAYFKRDLKEGDFFTQFFTVWRNGNQQGAPLMAMPACGGVTALFYNKDLFDASGVKYPDSSWTYETLLNAAKQFTKGEGAAKQWGFISDHGNSTGIDTYIYSNGGAILTPDLKSSALLTAESRQAVQSYIDLVRTHGVMPVPDPSQSLGQRFMQGKTAMMLNFDVAKQELARASFKWDLAVPPRGVAGVMSRQNGQAFGIARSCKQPDAAWQLIKYIVTLPDRQGVNELFSTAMPLYKPLANSPEYLEGTPKCDRRALLRINEGKVFNLITQGWQEWRDHAFIPGMQEMLAGRLTVDAGLAQISKKIDQVLTERSN
ncbi:MAG TPA: sugar ABC transporter substrate-binding protein [Candidatus Kapabacteria bacterium]|nr:sugar ABC transporter substrate-binding protein [Candidatus Kapabacteria bacterium]